MIPHNFMFQVEIDCNLCQNLKEIDCRILGGNSAQTHRRNNAHRKEGADNSRRPRGPTLTTTKLRLLIYIWLRLPYEEKKG